MLTAWTLARFKSVTAQTRLELAPLTVFAGANSSGKSTIIQSMLLTAQTLQSPVINRPVVLNGHIARLGSFGDIVSNANEDEEISIGFELSPSRSVDSRTRVFPGPRSTFGSYYYRRVALGPLTSIQCHFKFSVRRSTTDRLIARLQPNLEETTLKVSAAQDQPTVEWIVVRGSDKQLRDRMAALSLPDEQKNRPEIASLRYEVGELHQSSTAAGPQGWVYAGASLLHFLPNRVSLVYDSVDAEVRGLVETLLGGRPDVEPELVESVELLTGKVLSILADEFEGIKRELGKFRAPQRRVAQSLEEFTTDPSPQRLIQVYRFLPVALRAAIGQRLGDKTEELVAAARGDRPAKYEIRYYPLPPTLMAGVELVQEYFTSLVKYLGPLRDEPKPVYPLAGATDPKDVGFKGEHTAAVLHLHRGTTVTYIPTKAFGQEELELLPQPSRLVNAVLDWLNYMGVGTKIDTVDLGKLGHELKIATSGAAPLHDLTQVGVGVSQVLPILVLSLLAENGSTLIFEQPELHLHPRVQARLADFFVSMSRLGKQCIVETHSEYIVNRLRYLAAISEGREIADSAIIYFVEKEGSESTYRRVIIDEFGAIPDWPKGFFDESERLAAAALRAGVVKRKALRESR